MVTVHYPFHPYAGTSVLVLTVEKESVTVRGPDGRDLKVPKWMLSPSAHAEVCTEVVVGLEALRAVVGLVDDADRALTPAQKEVGDPRNPSEETARHAPTRAHALPQPVTTKGTTRSSATRAGARRRDDARSGSADGAGAARGPAAKRSRGQR